MNHEFADVQAAIRAADGATRAVYAASCAEFLLPIYRVHVQCGGRGDWGRMAQVGKGIWTGDPQPEAFASVEGLLEDEASPGWVETSAYGQSAVLAMLHALQCIAGSGDPESAAAAGSAAYEAVDYYVYHLPDIGHEPAVRAHPVVQSELARQLSAFEGERRRDDIRQVAKEAGELFARIAGQGRVVGTRTR